MKKRFFVMFSVSRALGVRFTQYMKEIGLIEFWEEPHNERALPHMYHTLDAEDDRLAKLREILTREGIQWTEREEHVYTDAELREFPLLELSVDRKPLVGGGPEYGTQYDMSTSCPQCGTGATQISPLMLPLEGFPKKGMICQTGRGHILVGSRLAEVLAAQQLTGLELRQAIFYRNDEPLGWWQIIAPHVLGRMTLREGGLGRDESPGWGCMSCRRDMFGGVLDDGFSPNFTRAAADVYSIPEVISTWECFGRSVLKDDPARSLIRGFAQPLIMVKPKVFDIIRGLKVKQASFTPIRIE